jgi:anti-sigma regulatory factor (Ser/Thr protein kinase)
MRSRLRGAGDGVEFWNMTELGRNPGRIIPAVRDWFDRGTGGRGRFIGEPIWPGRGRSEVVEATRHEALINLAFADVEATILCPYDASRLDPTVLFDAERTHPRLAGCCCEGPSANYVDPVELWHARDWPLATPHSAAASHPIDRRLGQIREIAASWLREAGLEPGRIGDIVLAVDEAATNALLHGSGDAVLRVWREPSRIICEISDHGKFEEVLAGRRRPGPDWPSGRGVWLMNQLCDLVELRPTDRGTVVRLHVEVGGGAPWPDSAQGRELAELI